MRSSRNQRLVWWHGGLWAAYSALTASFLIPFVLLFGASNSVVGILSAIPYIVIILTQIAGAKIVEYFPRKVVWVLFALMERLIWIMIALVPLFMQENVLLLVILFYVLATFFQEVKTPAWISLLNDIVPARVRGYFFGKNQMVINFAAMLAFLAGGFFLDIFPEGEVFPFSVMFCFATLSGIGSVYAVLRMREPPSKDHNHHHMGEFFRLQGEFRKFVLILALFRFAALFASPFFIVYMLDDLGLSYTFFVVLIALSIFMRVVSQVHFGRIADRVGDKPVALISMLGTSLVPLFFLFSSEDLLWPVVFAQLLAGLAWGGFETVVNNLLLDLSDKETITVHTATYNMVTSVAMILGPILGGFVADKLSLFTLSGIPLVFAIAILLRAGSAVWMASLKEPRAKKEYSLRYVFQQVVHIHPVQGLQHRLRKLKNNKR